MSALANFRTPEQECAYREARCLADEISDRQQRDVGVEELARIYMATLHDHMQKAIRRYLDAKISFLAMLPSPGFVLHEDGHFEVMQAPADTCDAILMLDEIIERTKARYMKGLFR